MTAEVFRFTALRVEQREDIPLYVFAATGNTIQQFAGIRLAERSSDGSLSGYQRGRVPAHIAEIREYLLDDDAILPNAIVVAFDDRVIFEPAQGVVRSTWGTPGKLLVPIPGPRGTKCGLIVDGQQRVAALAQLPPDRNFPVVVVSFAAPSAEFQLEQFVLVNKTRPLPRDLVNELLPNVASRHLPKSWNSRYIASQVVDRMRFDQESPFFGRIRGIGTTFEGCNISQAAVMAAVTKSLGKGGVLRRALEDGLDLDGLAKVVSSFFKGVSRVWPEAWAGSPWTSRLVHGCGITALGTLMDVVMRDVDGTLPRAWLSVQSKLAPLASFCAWTSGKWPAPLSCPWDALQNTSQDKKRLAAYLLQLYQASTL